MYIVQIEHGQMSNFSYLVGCEKTKNAIVIDPGVDLKTILKKAEEKGFEIQYIFNTHGHHDHTAGNVELKKVTGAEIVMHSLDAHNYKGEVDIKLTSEKTFEVGAIEFQIFHTPGHTPGGICLYAKGNLFTGDTLFVGDSGRTDLPGGDRPTLGASIRMLMELPDETVVWSGHNLGPTKTCTLAWQKRNNVNRVEYGFSEG